MPFSPAATEAQINHRKANLFERRIYSLTFLFDLLALALTYKIAMPLSLYLIEIFNTSNPADFYNTLNAREVVYFALCMGVVLFFMGTGQYSRRVPWWRQVQVISKTVLFALIIDGFTSYVLGLYYSRMFILTNWVLAFTFLIGLRFLLNIIKAHAPLWQLPTVIMADRDTAIDVMYAMAADTGVGLVAHALLLRDRDPTKTDPQEFPVRNMYIAILDGLDGYNAYIRENPDKFYIIALESFRSEKRDALLDLLAREKVRYSIIPPTSRLSLYHTEPMYFFGNDAILLHVKYTAITLRGRVLKRVMDIGGACIGLICFSPVFLAVMIMLKVEGQGGSLFYNGMRLGKNGTLFKCWKFRTMEPNSDHLLNAYLKENSDAAAHWTRFNKLPDDPRIRTKTSKFIRRASIDELPQLWNVLKGEMSLVGPRPILESETTAYGSHLDNYTSVKPGITGLWQVSGRNDVSFQRRVQWDAWYIRNWTLWGDVVIILKTVWIVLRGTGA